MVTRPRNKRGQYIIFSNNQTYKQCQINGKRKQTHILVWENFHNKEVPKGYVIHHKNKNKKDNQIENLKLMPIAEHIKFHFNEYYKNHDVWNKGKKCPNISKSLQGHKLTNKQINKDKVTWFNKYLDRYINIWKLKDKNFSVKQISKKLNLTKNQVTNGWRRFKKSYLIPFGEVNND